MDALDAFKVNFSKLNELFVERIIFVFINLLKNK